jgi:hypothetical protein
LITIHAEFIGVDGTKAFTKHSMPFDRAVL